jgi:hypothetical protein
MYGDNEVELAEINTTLLELNNQPTTTIRIKQPTTTTIYSTKYSN